MGTIRHSGKDLYISINGVVVNAEFRSISVVEFGKRADASAGFSRARTYITTLRSPEFIIEYFEAPESQNVELRTALALRTSVTLVYAPEGTDPGNPRYSCIATVTDVRSSPYEHIDAVSATLLRNGEQLKDVF